MTAFFYALSNVLELTEAEQVPDEYALRVGLMTRLVRRPRWLLGLLSDVFGYVCQAGALALAAVVFVEPILALAIVMSLMLGAAMTHRRLRPGDWVSAAVLSGGLALFLYEVVPTGGREFVPTDRVVIAGPITAVVIVGCIACARPSRGAPRAALLGIAAGISFGAAAVLTKGVVHYLGDGILAWIPHWESYALAATSIGGVIVGQSAFQTGALAASAPTRSRRRFVREHGDAGAEGLGVRQLITGRPSGPISQSGLYAISQTWPSGSATCPSYMPHSSARTGLTIVPPAATAVAIASSTSAGLSRFIASRMPPKRGSAGGGMSPSAHMVSAGQSVRNAPDVRNSLNPSSAEITTSQPNAR